MKTDTLNQLVKPAKKDVPRQVRKPDPDLPAISEIVADNPDPIPPDVSQELSTAEQLVAGLDEMEVESILENIRSYSGHVESFASAAAHAGAQANVWAWTCGKLLIEAKKKLGHGKFGKWLVQNLPNVGERTAQRYMKLAKDFNDVRALLESEGGVHQGFVASGILPEPERATGDAERVNSPKAQALLRSLTGLQKNLRLFSASNEKLGDDERVQLILVRVELDRFFDQALTHNNTSVEETEP